MSLEDQDLEKFAHIMQSFDFVLQDELYPPAKPRAKAPEVKWTAKQLSDATKCGLTVAKMVVDCLPHEVGFFGYGDYSILINSGILIFKNTCDSCPEFTAQGYVALMTDTAGNLVMVSTEQPFRSEVLLVACDTAPCDETDLELLAVVSRYKLLNLMEKCREDWNFDPFEGCTPYIKKP
jgi:hypothetical protein